MSTTCYKLTIIVLNSIGKIFIIVKEAKLGRKWSWARFLFSDVKLSDWITELFLCCFICWKEDKYLGWKRTTGNHSMRSQSTATEFHSWQPESCQGEFKESSDFNTCWKDPLLLGIWVFDAICIKVIKFWLHWDSSSYSALPNSHIANLFFVGEGLFYGMER